MLLQLAFSLFFASLLIAGPKRIYWHTKAWRYQNPENMEPSEDGYYAQRFFLALATTFSVLWTIGSL
jgi:hypothetical protein